MILANAVHFYTYYAHVLNALPTALTIAFAVMACLLFIAAADELILLLFSLVFGLAILIPVYTMNYHHKEFRHGVEMQIEVNHQKVWIPAKQLSNGVYWPDGYGFTSLTKHKNATP